MELRGRLLLGVDHRFCDFAAFLARCAFCWELSLRIIAVLFDTCKILMKAMRCLAISSVSFLGCVKQS